MQSLNPTKEYLWRFGLADRCYAADFLSWLIEGHFPRGLQQQSTEILKNCDYSIGSHPEGGSITWSQEILHKAPIISTQ